MNMVIHDLRNPTALIDANLDSLAEIMGMQNNNYNSEVTPRNTGVAYVNKQKKSQNYSPKAKDTSPGRHGTGGTGEEFPQLIKTLGFPKGPLDFMNATSGLKIRKSGIDESELDSS
jgi:hypothetical protein